MPNRLPPSARAPLVGALLALALAAPAAAARAVRVPQDVRGLQEAFGRAASGGLVVVAPGTYAAPARAFRIGGRKRLTVRAEVPGTVVLDGQGARQVLRIEGNSPTQRPAVTFQGITFRGGSATLGGAVFLRQGEAVFRNCRFEDNAASQQGGAILALDARLVLDRSTLLRNRAHATNGAGGALWARRSLVTVRRSRFEGNRAGWVGGAVYAYGDYRAPAGAPTTLVDVSGTDFVGNAAERTGCCPPGPTVGGALHGEDQTTIRVTGSRLLANRAETGGGLSLYRAHGEVRDSVFRGNALLPGGGAGAALLLLSPDFADSSTAGGAIDRPPGSLVAERTLFQGAPGPGAAAPAGGCMTLGGDTTSLLGGGGVPRRGSAAEHRAPVALHGVVFAYCASAGGGGALAANLVELDVRDSLFVASSAAGDGGAVSLFQESSARFTDTTFAGNLAAGGGGAVRAAGSGLEVAGGAFLHNEVGGADPARSRGADLLTIPTSSGGRPSPATGVVEGALFAGGRGLPLFEVDDPGPPSNGMRYDGNRFHGSGFGPVVFFNRLAGANSVAALNVLVLARPDGGVTTKSAVDNVELFAPPAHGALRAAPSQALVLGPEGGVEPAWLGYAWTGAFATVGGGGLPQRQGLIGVPSDGVWTLEVDGVPKASASVGSGG